MLKLLREVVLFTWCLPQTLLGLALVLFFKSIGKVKSVVFKSEWGTWMVTVQAFRFGAISLGAFIIMQDGCGEITEKHEHGHTLQGFLLGPLYLFLVGIPSFLRATGFVVLGKSKGYYDGYPENWADILGGVKRS